MTISHALRLSLVLGKLSLRQCEDLCRMAETWAAEREKRRPVKAPVVNLQDRRRP